ncbi:beta-lactamase/transpeptidase-like protein [Trametes sanguinea]|nr:beta-lactamase/transpeptidase-like protein [Trametes sanguinea]
MISPVTGWLAVILQLLPIVNAGNVSLPEVITPDVSRFVEGVLNVSTIPGLSMGVVRLDDAKQPVVELAAWGRRTEDGGGIDLTPDTLFALASCSKAFLVTSIGLLMDDYAQGRNVTPLPPSVAVFDWDTKMADLLPEEWALEDPWASKKANLRDAFGHVTGLPRHDYSYRPGDTAEDVVLRMRHLPPAYELREKWSYNNQKYANATIGSFVVSGIFEPLNMSSSSYTPSNASRSGRLTQTWTPHGVRRIPYWLPDKVNDLFAGPGGVISSAEDMTKWLATLLNQGVDPRTNKTIVPASTFANMTTARAIQNGLSSPDTSITGYGMGWFRMTHKGRDVVWHSGAIPGFSLLVAFLPEDNLGVVLLANMDDKADDVMSVLYRVIDEALDLPENIERDVSDGIHQIRLFGTQKTYVAETHAEPLPMPLEAYGGLYANIAYGNITLCTPTNTSSHCSQVLAQFAPVEAASGAPLPEERLYAAWQRVWSTHLRVVHRSANSFDLVLPALFPNGYGRNTTAFEYHDPVNSVGRVEFLVEDHQVRGFALITEEDAADARAARTNGTVQEIGDAWFDKL